MSTPDQDRHVAPVAQNSWDTHVSFAPVDAEAAADASSLGWTVDKEVGEGEYEKLALDSTQMAPLLVFVQRALLDPLALHAYSNPVQVPVELTFQCRRPYAGTRSDCLCAGADSEDG
jgi:hypothetical protein